METSQELRRAVSDWHTSATAAIAAARSGARMTLLALDREPLDGEPAIDPERAAEDLIRAGDSIAAALAPWLGNSDGESRVFETDRLEGQLTDEPSEIGESSSLDVDGDAATHALALFCGSLEVVDALSGVTAAPGAVLAEHRITSFAEYGRDSEGRVEELAGVMLGSPAGGAGAPASALPHELQRLGDAAGDETVALVSDAFGARDVSGLIEALTKLGAKDVATAFETVYTNLTRWIDRFKRAATKVVEWLATKATELLPGGAGERVVAFVRRYLSALADPGEVVGNLLLKLFGSDRLISQWNNWTDPPQRPGVGDDLVNPYIDRIGWVTKGRQAIDRWGLRVVLDIARREPNVMTSYYIVVTVAIVFVGSQAGLGVHALDRVLNPATGTT